MKADEREDEGRAGGTHPGDRWRLQDAKARLSEVVRRARDHRPQRVTVHGRDAVVVVAAEDYDRLRPGLTGAAIVAALRASPLHEIELERMSVRAPIRDVEL
jgi:prevent-host-death family protein